MASGEEKQNDAMKVSDERLVAAVGEAAAPPVVVFAFFGEGLVEAPAAGFDAAVKSEPEGDGEKSGDECESGGVAKSDSGGAGNARGKRAIGAESSANVNRIGEREDSCEEAEESADAEEKRVPGMLGRNVWHFGKPNLYQKFSRGKWFRSVCFQGAQA